MTTVQQSIIDEGSAPLFDEFTNLIHQKAAKLKKLQNTDIFEWSEKYGADAANFKFRETEAAKHELNVLIAISQYINEMSDCYDSDVLELTDKLTGEKQFSENLQTVVFNLIT